MKREDLVKEVRTWIGTPFHHQGRLKGVGADCAGFLREAAKAIGIETPEDYINYSKRPDGSLLIGRLRPMYEEIAIDEAKEGDLLVFRIGGRTQHIAMITAKGVMIHSVKDYGVVEVPIDESWQSRIETAYKIKGVED